MIRPHLPRVSIQHLVFAIAGLGLVCMAGDIDPLPPSHTPATAPGTAVMRARLNQETGTIDVGASSAAAQFDPDTEQALRRDAAGLTEVRRPDGTVLLDLQGRFQSVAMVHRRADGKLLICTDNEVRAQDALHGDLPAATTPEVK
ncbi:MAG TPA: hypothetical protein VF247_03960 [Candidatus Krumholzibacteria bacterium]